jgi:hypothetical protein
MGTEERQLLGLGFRVVRVVGVSASRARTAPNVEGRASRGGKPKSVFVVPTFLCSYVPDSQL